jgi:hypothetical protein
MSIVTRRTSALAGLAVAPFWIGITAALTFLEYDYLQSIGWGATTENEVPYPSAMLRSDLGLVQSVNFVVTGVFIALLMLGLRREFQHRVLGWVATVGLGVVAVGMVLNAGTTDLPDEPATMSGNIHVLGFILVLLGMVFVPPFTALALRGNDAWRGWRWLGWWPAMLFVISATNLGLSGDLGFIVFVALIFTWFSLIGGRLLAVDRAEGAEPGSAALPDAAAPGLL